MADREYVIVTDSTADIPKKYYEKHKIRVLGMPYSMDGKEYLELSGTDLDLKTFYTAVSNGSLPKTAQIPYDHIVALFEEIVKDGKDIFFLGFSSELSGSYNTGVTVAEEISEKYPEARIRTVDSISASTGEGFVLYNCVTLRDKGMGLDELAEYAEMIKKKTVHLFTVNDLGHLHRGGRLSKMSAVMGTLLGVKPILYFNEKGQLLPYSKARGKKAALTAMAQEMVKTCIPEENEEIFISAGEAREDCEFLGELIKSLIPQVKKVHYGNIGAVIGSHVGQGTVALFYIAKDRTIVPV